MSIHTSKESRTGFPTFGLPGPRDTAATTGRSGGGFDSSNQFQILNDAGTVVLQADSTGFNVPAGSWQRSVVSDLAATGSVIANAAAIVSQTVNVTAGDNTKGVILPSSAPIGTDIKIYVTGASAGNGTKLYPPVNGTINGGSANAAITLEDKTGAVLVRMSETNWSAMFTANT